jgi:hypothetical protein
MQQRAGNKPFDQFLVGGGVILREARFELVQLSEINRQGKALSGCSCKVLECNSVCNVLVNRPRCKIMPEAFFFGISVWKKTPATLQTSVPMAAVTGRDPCHASARNTQVEGQFCVWSALVELQVAALAKRACSCTADDNLIDADGRSFLLSSLTPLNVTETGIRAKKYFCPLVLEIGALGDRFKIDYCIFLFPQNIIASLFIRQRFQLNDFGPGALMKLRSLRTQTPDDFIRGSLP